MVLRVYTVFYLLLYLFVTFNPANMALYGVWEFVDIIIMITSIVGMAAYAFEFRVASHRFWEYFFYLYIIFEAVYMSWLQGPLLEKMEMAEHASQSNMINAVMMAPAVYALYRLRQSWSAPSPEAGG